MITFSKEKVNTSIKERMDHKDSLTGAGDKWFVQEILKGEISLKKMIPEHNFSLISCQLKKMDEITEKFGEGAHDAFILACHEILANSLREVDFIARFQKNDFFILCSSINKREACKLTKKIFLEANQTSLELMDKSKKPAIIPMDINLHLASSEDLEPEEITVESFEESYFQKIS